MAERYFQKNSHKCKVTTIFSLNAEGSEYNILIDELQNNRILNAHLSDYPV